MLNRCILLLLAGLAVSAPAQTQSNPPPPDTRPLFARINGLFGGDLPQLDRPDAIKLILRPHFGDLIHRDYMRVDTGLRWALNDQFELNTEASVFFKHGLKSGSAGNGIGDLRFGAKYIFVKWPEPDFETSVALNIDHPTGRPPIDLTDGYNHVSPTIVVQYRPPRYPRLTTFAGMGLDLMTKSRVAGTLGFNQPHDDSISTTAGGVYDAGQLKWTIAGTYATTALFDRRTNNFVYLQPGLLWYVPSRFTLHSKTQWIVGFGARATFGPDGTHLSLSSRLRAEITFRQVMDKMGLHKSPESK